jgi:hypothetical protein
MRFPYARLVTEMIFTAQREGMFPHAVNGFWRGLNDTGFVEGQNVTIEYWWARGEYDRLPALAAELVQRRVRVIMAGGGEVGALAAKGATSTIPILITPRGISRTRSPAGMMMPAEALSCEHHGRRTLRLWMS